MGGFQLFASMDCDRGRSKTLLLSLFYLLGDLMQLTLVFQMHRHLREFSRWCGLLVQLLCRFQRFRRVEQHMAACLCNKLVHDSKLCRVHRATIRA